MYSKVVFSTSHIFFKYNSLWQINYFRGEESLKKKKKSKDGLFLFLMETTYRLYLLLGSDKCHQATFHIGFCTCINSWGGFINQLRQAFPNLFRAQIYSGVNDGMTNEDHCHLWRKKEREIKRWIHVDARGSGDEMRGECRDNTRSIYFFFCFL